MCYVCALQIWSLCLTQTFDFGSGTIQQSSCLNKLNQLLILATLSLLSGHARESGLWQTTHRALENSIGRVVIRFFTAHLFHVTWEQIRTYFLLNSRLAAICRTSNNLIKWLRWILMVTAVAYLMLKKRDHLPKQQFWWKQHLNAFNYIQSCRDWK